jgi:hypothetical protein
MPRTAASNGPLRRVASSAPDANFFDHENMWRFYAAVALVWLVLMPPLFTGGACTAEFDTEAERVSRDNSRLLTPESARDYFRSRDVPVSLLTSRECRDRKPRFLDRCGPGSLVYAKVPVKNTICSIYRDEDIKLLMQYDERGHLTRFNADMAPFKSLQIPLTTTLIHWGR